MPRCVEMGFSNTMQSGQCRSLKYTELLQMHPLIFCRKVLKMLAEGAYKYLGFFFLVSLIAVAIGNILVQVDVLSYLAVREVLKEVKKPHCGGMQLIVLP